MNGSGKVIKMLALVMVVLVGLFSGSRRALAQGEDATVYLQTGSMDHFEQYLFALEQMEAAFAASYAEEAAMKTEGDRFEQYLTALEQDEMSRQLALSPSTTGSPKVLLARLSERGDTAARFEQYQQAIALMEQEISAARSGQ